MTPLMWAAWKGQVGFVKWLIASSVKLDRQDKWGRTAVFLAADEGHSDVVGAVGVICEDQLISPSCIRRFACCFKPVPKLIFWRCEVSVCFLSAAAHVLQCPGGRKESVACRINRC
jgi:hypothetical protein